eukprot:979094-Amphidinium_carterae.1
MGQCIMRPKACRFQTTRRLQGEFDAMKSCSNIRTALEGNAFVSERGALAVLLHVRNIGEVQQTPEGMCEGTHGVSSNQCQ